MSVSKQEDDVRPSYETEAILLKALGSVAHILANVFFYPTNDTDESVTGHSSWPQNRPFDANLAQLISCNTS
jgi:hypothetical protein